MTGFIIVFVFGILLLVNVIGGSVFFAYYCIDLDFTFVKPKDWEAFDDINAFGLAMRLLGILVMLPTLLFLYLCIAAIRMAAWVWNLGVRS